MPDPGPPRVRGVNHITLAVRDLDRSWAFYVDLLGLTPHHRWPRGAYLTAGGLWIALSASDTARAEPHPDDTHLAFDVAPDDFAPLRDRVLAAGATVWRDNTSEGESLYVLDPDGHRLELHIGSLESRLASMEPTETHRPSRWRRKRP